MSHLASRCLQHLAQWNPVPDQQTIIIWDGASWHSKTAIVRQQAAALGFSLIQLPSYSPDLTPLKACGNGCVKI